VASWSEVEAEAPQLAALARGFFDAHGLESHRFRADVTELVVVRHGDPKDHIVVESWHEGVGVRRRKRF
jgi:hypothetical protein